ncbi:MAG: YceI family protein [Maricaulaceae bacterium]
MRFRSQIFSLAAFTALVACGVNSSNAQVTSDVKTTSVATVEASTGTWAVRADESTVTFTGKQTGNDFTGEFKDFTAEIIFDPENLSAASVKAVIDMSSFDAGDNDRNDALPGKEWFSVKKFPNAVFTADEFTMTDTGYAAAGELSLRGVSLPVTLPFDLSITDDVATMNGELVIDRSDFGVGQGAWAKGEWVDLNVTVNVTIVADAN